jgi:hypothetical protein
MSTNRTPLPESFSPGSPHYSEDLSESDINPSTSAGNRSPCLHARTLSGEMVLAEASESLLAAAETLATAAHAMSKAAALLARAREYLATGKKYEQPDLYDSQIDTYQSSSSISSPLPQQSYHTHSTGNQETSEFCS